MTAPSPRSPMKGRPQPSRADVERSDRLTVISHPLADTLVTLLRDTSTPARDFEMAIQELTRHLLWQATVDEPRRQTRVTGFDGSLVAGSALERNIASLIILRAGLGMLPPVRMLIPDAPNYQVGIKRDEATLAPRLYYSNLPERLDERRHVLLLDPMLATGGSAGLAIERLRSGFSGQISFLGIIGAPIGVQKLLDADPDIRIYLAALDDRLNDDGYIVPGLGDAGDRLFGTN